MAKRLELIAACFENLFICIIYSLCAGKLISFSRDLFCCFFNKNCNVGPVPISVILTLTDEKILKIEVNRELSKFEPKLIASHTV